MNILHQVRLALRRWLARIERRRARQFLSMPVKPPGRWPTVNDSHSVDSFRRINR